VKRSEVWGSKLWLNEGKASWHYVFHYCFCLVYSMLIFININLYNCCCEIYITVVVIICIHSVYCVLYCVRSFVCCVSFDRCVILCDACYLFVVSYCKPLPPGKNPFAINKYYIILLFSTPLSTSELSVKPQQIFCVTYFMALEYYLNVQKYTTTWKTLSHFHNAAFWSFDVNETWSFLIQNGLNMDTY
jgi:hypothetical protein